MSRLVASYLLIGYPPVPLGRFRCNANIQQNEKRYRRYGVNKKATRKSLSIIHSTMMGEAFYTGLERQYF